MKTASLYAGGLVVILPSRLLSRGIRRISRGKYFVRASVQSFGGISEH